MAINSSLTLFIDAENIWQIPEGEVEITVVQQKNDTYYESRYFLL